MNQEEIKKEVCPECKVQLTVRSHNTYRCPYCSKEYTEEELKGIDTRGGA